MHPPPIFGEVVLSQVYEIGIDVFVKKRMIYRPICVYIINEIYVILSHSRDRGKD